MNEFPAICGRNDEIQQIYKLISYHSESKKSAILYLTGPPGTGKTMSIHYVLDQIGKNIPKLTINCLSSQSPKGILTRLCNLAGLEKFVRHNESEMLARLSKKFNSRTSSPYIIVLDEMDQLPKSKNVDLIRTIFSWPDQPNSKLILVGIANTVNLTSKYQTISSVLGKDFKRLTKVIFKPYKIKDIKEILGWYLENDENFEDAVVDQKALDLISAKYARENGDIRAALNALKSAIDDTVKKTRCETPELQSRFPTPPATPPSTPCKEATNIASLANSIKKRQRNTHYIDDVFPFLHQIILTCVLKLCSSASNFMADSKICKNLVIAVSSRYGLAMSSDDYRAMLDNLELQGLISFKRGRQKEWIVLKASKNELTNLVQRQDMIMELINTLI